VGKGNLFSEEQISYCLAQSIRIEARGVGESVQESAGRIFQRPDSGFQQPV
jgi:hypothetical protein